LLISWVKQEICKFTEIFRKFVNLLVQEIYCNIYKCSQYSKQIELSCSNPNQHRQQQQINKINKINNGKQHLPQKLLTRLASFRQGIHPNEIENNSNLKDISFWLITDYYFIHQTKYNQNKNLHATAY
jgi:hypothetical protein